ncbi:hypothetical protein NL676_039407 [Syzygium grande]|nr:hypothetical protein NL676_039407 [Syzygium grande]
MHEDVRTEQPQDRGRTFTIEGEIQTSQSEQMATKMHQRRKPGNGGRHEVSDTAVALEPLEDLAMMALGNDGNPAKRRNRSMEIFRGDAERIEVATAGLKARCRELRHGITVPRSEEGRRGGGDHHSGEPPIRENGLLGCIRLMDLREELRLIFI